MEYTIIAFEGKKEKRWPGWDLNSRPPWILHDESIFFSNLNNNFSDLLDMRNLQEQVKQARKGFRPPSAILVL